MPKWCVLAFFVFPWNCYSVVLAQTVAIPIEGEQLRLLSADLNADQAPDLVVLDRETGVVTIYLRDTFGGFFTTDLLRFETPSNSRNLYAGLADDDEWPDVVVAGGNRSHTVALGDESGFFFPVTIDVPRVRSRSELVDDVDGDGFLEIITGDEDGNVSVVAPIFPATESLALDASVERPDIFASGDFTGDGNKGFAVWGFASSSEIAFFESSDEGYRLDGAVHTPLPGGIPLMAVAAQLDGDSAEELLLLAVDKQHVPSFGFLYLVERAAGEYRAVRLGRELPLHQNAALLVSDLDSNGSSDIVFFDGASDVLFFLHGGEGIGFLPPCVLTLEARGTSIAIADFDLDGVQDLAAALPERDEVQVLFSALASCAVADSGYRASSPYEISGLQHLEVLDSGEDSTGVLFVGEGETALFAFGVSGRIRKSYRTPTQVGGLAIGNVDGDTVEDFVLTDQRAGDIYVYTLQSSGDVRSVLHIEALGATAGVVLADFDGNGSLDIAASVPASDRIVVLLQEDGRFSSGEAFAVGQTPSSLAAGDVDNDGIGDLVVLIRDASNVSLLRGLPEGGFTPFESFRVLGEASDLALGDLDANGSDEILVTSRQASTLTVMTYLEGTLRPQFVTLAPGSLPTAIEIADLNLDGALDVAVAKAGPQILSVLQNDAGELQIPRPVGLGLVPSTAGDLLVASGDLDANGCPELIVGNSRDATVTVHFAAGCEAELDFLRGDSNQSGAVDLADAVHILNGLFLGGALSCHDAADANDDGALNLTDAVYTLTHLFLRGPPPPPPFPETGRDTTFDGLGCAPRR